MGLAATAAKLLASLDLDTKPFEAGARRAGTTLDRMGSRFGKIGSLAQKGLGTAITNVKRLGVAAAGFVGVNVFQGLQSLATLEDAVTSVDGAIKQMGQTGQVTGQQVATWANEIEESVQRAFDDKEITQGATTLIRYGKVAPESLRHTLEVMTDLAAKTGSVESASSKLAKSLADPTKATRVLREVGVTLTKEQTKQIAQWVEQGKLGKAQALILQEVEEATKGAAAAMHGPFRDAMLILDDVKEDAQRALGEALLPLLGKVATKLSTFLADPKNVQSIRDFGKGLADGFDKLLGLVEKIPFDQIGASLKIAGAGAKALFDAFTSLPPWVQTAVLTGWGLNKLTGGALGGIVGELAKGLVKGVLGIQAGVVNVSGGVVNAGGGVPGSVGGAATGGLGLASKLFLVGETIGLVLAVNEVRDNIATKLTEQSSAIHDAVTAQIAAGKPLADLKQSLAGVDQGIEKLSHDPIGNLLLGDQLSELQKMREEVVAALEENKKDSEKNLQPLPENITRKQEKHFNKLRDRIETQRIQTVNRLDQNKAALDRVRERAAAIQTATVGAGNKMAAAQATAADRIVTAINALSLSPTLVASIVIGGAASPTGQVVNRNQIGFNVRPGIPEG